VSIDRKKLVKLRFFLRSNKKLVDVVSEERTQFLKRAGIRDKSGWRGRLGSLAAAVKEQPALWGFFGGLMFIVAGYIGEHLLRVKSPEQVVQPESFQKILLDVFSSKPANLLQEVLHSLPTFCVVLGVLLLLATGISVVFTIPAKPADLLVSRLLWKKLGAKSYPSNGFIQSLFADPRFKKILQKAVYTVLPLEATNPTSKYIPWNDGTATLNLASLPADWDDFIERLIEALDSHEPFVHLMNYHPGVEPEALHDKGLKACLEYGVRQLVYTEVFNDPDCAPLYEDATNVWEGLIHWIKTADLKKLGEALPKSEKPSGGIDKKSLAIYVLVLLLFAGLLQKLAWPTPSNGGKNNDPPATTVVKLDAQQLVEELAKLSAKLCLPCAAQQQPTAPQPVFVLIPASPSSIPTPPSSTVNVPTVNLPSKIEVDLSSSVPGAKTEIQQNVGIAPPGLTSGETPHEPPWETKRMHGDTLVSFTRHGRRKEQQETTPPPPQKSDNQTKEDRASNTPPPEKTEAVAQQSTAAGTELTSPLHLRSPSGVDCVYSATLQGSLGKWPPDPVEMKVQSSGYLSQDCPRMLAEGTIVSAGRRPLYNDDLKAYVSIDEKHSRHFHSWGHDQIIVLIHYATPNF
jgi:hypothetical protein